ncbi:aldehyde dehydrogenase family protein [Nakamurella lactea]|uniref:aldehyde dehydrogenase family protein n=1 Tax=Nakamurella lactea TaxID=459515 RepID=UPI00040AD079|nr:aldehyde dehydrogenase family protein [Nakamurella lactea]
MEHRDDLYVGGQWVPARGTELIAVIDPSTEECVATIRESSELDVDAAVEAAAAAVGPLGRMSADERAAMLDAVADALERRLDSIADAISREMGMPRHLTGSHQAEPAIRGFRNSAKGLAQVNFTEQVGHSTIRREPVGVVAAITPWNYPLMQIASKVGPALAAGCPVVLKPSEIAPLDAYLLAEAIDEVGLPAGTFNLVVGTGPHVGEMLVRHPKVDMVSLTGSTRAGQRVGQLAAGSIKRLALELGGKSPSVVLEDGDLDAAVAHSVHSVMVNSGQTCTALTRLLVPLDLLAEAEAAVVARMSSYQVGPATESSSDLGPLAYAAQVQRVEEHLERAVLDGARSIFSYDRDRLPDNGYYVPPTAFVATDPAIPLVQQEIFGPVIVVQPYLTLEEAIELANGTEYGLAAAVWSKDADHAMDVASRVRAGTVDINGAPFNSLAPFGGYKKSGHGRELGSFGILEFTELKSVQLPEGSIR